MLGVWEPTRVNCITHSSAHFLHTRQCEMRSTSAVSEYPPLFALETIFHFQPRYTAKFLLFCHFSNLTSPSPCSSSFAKMPVSGPDTLQNFEIVFFSQSFFFLLFQNLAKTPVLTAWEMFQNSNLSSGRSLFLLHFNSLSAIL